MTDTAALLDAYPALSPSERATVDARVADLPEWAQAYADARRLAALVDVATAPPDADDVARAAVGRRMGWASAHAHPSELAAEADRVEARLRELDAGAEDPVARFERLTGVALREAPEIGGDSLPAEPVLGLPPASPGRRAPWWVAATAAVAVAYVVLLAVSTTASPERARVAGLGEIEAAPPPAPLATDDEAEPRRLTHALRAVRDARRSTLGLFPSYDAAGLDAAADTLGAIARQADPASWVSQEARLAWGRVLLYRGRDAEAARVLGALVTQGGYRGSAARRLLDALRAPV
ncbi:hypothetical protein [Rubrivirga sp.]|uniref:hypothetical protein n=1 Tax=Rubrivirga sp. TaxID=1885344 RepID=UPI003B51E0A5